MGKMMIEIPDDRTVQVIVGDAGLAVAPARPQITDKRIVRPRRRRPWLMLTGSLAVLAVGFVLGQHTITSHAEAEAQTARTVNRAPPPVQQAFPAHALPLPKAAAAGQVPPALTAQLAQRPHVVPAPGQPQAAAQPQKNPFGLGD